MNFKTAKPRYVESAYIKKYLEELSKLAKFEGAHQTDEYIWKLYRKIQDTENKAEQQENRK